MILWICCIVLSSPFRAVHSLWILIEDIILWTYYMNSFCTSNMVQYGISIKVSHLYIYMNEGDGSHSYSQRVALALYPISYTPTSVISPSLMPLPLLYPETLENGCSKFKSPFLLSHFPPTYQGLWHQSNPLKHLNHKLAHITLSSFVIIVISANVDLC